MIERVRGRRAATFLFATTVALVTAAGPAVATGPPRAPLDGTWRMDGYGTLVSIGGGRLVTYDTTGVSCLKGLRDAPAVEGAPGTFRQGDDAAVRVELRGRDRAVLSFDDNVGHRSLRRIASLPAACGEEPAPGRVGRAENLRVFDVFWQTYAENYPFFAAKHVDWDAVRERYRPRAAAAATEDELFAVLQQMIEPLHDGHTGILNAGVTPPRHFGGHRPDVPTPSRDDLARLEKAVTAASGVPAEKWRRWGGEHAAVAYARLPDGTGLLRVTGFQNFTGRGFDADRALLDGALDEVFGPLAAGRRGLVLDLRVNGGGSDRLALHVAGRLTDRPYVAYLKHARNDPADPRRFTRAEPVRVTPHHGPVHTGPLAVLTGPLTVSAGETLTQALTGRPYPTARIGENTYGIFSDTLDRVLPNGWTFTLPNEEYLSAADGRTTYDGTGVPPTDRRPVFRPADLAQGRDPALTAARRWLSTAG
ncbi:peptidase [Streptomyces mashuensis]|uniref:Peptidase n=1 Tax=Streptomyces mashuensis TaxID=33904 RepID=A0A919ED25_9ACTN|nr:S41 family peptidase [Streptomyces mashuensis]GHF41214.1 peptidase [Streptomyces mashuensis]